MIPRVTRGSARSLAASPHDVYVPHGEDVQVTCDVGYVIVNTINATATGTCDRSDASGDAGSFGAALENVDCVGEIEVAFLS